MFKKARRKIVVTIFAILCAVLVCTLGLIYISSYYSITAQNIEVLETHAQMLVGNEVPKNGGREIPDGELSTIPEEKAVGELSNIPKGKSADEFSDAPEAESSDEPEEAPKAESADASHDPEGKTKGQDRIERHLKVNVFYAVILSDDGTGQVIENVSDGIYTDEELIDLAKKVQSDTKGKTGDLLYYVSSNDHEIFVCFMDNMVFTDSFTHLFLYTLLFGILAIAVITILSVRIADRIVSPMEETYLKQKQFTADAGHELKTPISAMAANIELLQRELGDNKWLDNISHENKRMKELVTELLELARNENKSIERKTTDLSRLANGVILPLEATAFENHILIDADIADGIVSMIDEKSVGQLVAILVDNAISHTKCHDGKIERVVVTLREVKGTAILRVSNPGQEIPQNEREKLFERFYRTDRSHEFTGHYGLGLAIAKAICDANHAKISVDCQDGQVTFSVCFASK